jgi:hypothetical protein
MKELLDRLLVSLALLLMLSPSVHADVTLTMSKPSYALGEEVSFVLANDTKWTIVLSYGPGWSISDSLTHFAPCSVVPIMWDFLPGWTDRFEWDQRDCFDGTQVPAGRYRVIIGYQCDECPVYSNVLETWFTIGTVAVEPTSWGRIKAILRGEG